MHRLGLLSASLLLSLAVVVASIVLAPVRQPAPAGDAAARPQPASAGVGPVDVLRSWDRRRADAWARGDAVAVGRLYVRGSRSGRRDVRMLDEYAARGLRVTGLCTQLLGVRVVHASADRLSLAVTDRVCGGAVRALGSGEVVGQLPVDRADRRRVDLVRVGERWLVEEVRTRARSRSLRGRRRRGTCSRPSSGPQVHRASSRAPPVPSGRRRT